MALKRASRLALLATVALTMIACGGKALRWEAREYVVRPGDTLQSIAFRHGVDADELAAWNRLDDPDLIFAGQRLRLSPPPGYRARRPPGPAGNPEPSVAPEAPAVAAVSGWQWPGDGAILARYGDATSLGRGLDLGGKRGNPVLAAADGRVVYSGSGLLGYGNLIILKHNDTFLSAYGHNDTLLVREGETVSGGQRIATMGLGPGDRAVLHFEIRKNGRPVDPLKYLPAR